ncbi:hypothetical protein V5O48_018314 [Marasmius crinis-equi]|uniref:CxC6 like cysteine cluster associated with KDZ domain-containing protein n=1 Tax=Marasmius crinis-equi TaxID=585013 RepID=A0ABR3ELI9_9AGAR
MVMSLVLINQVSIRHAGTRLFKNKISGPQDQARRRGIMHAMDAVGFLRTMGFVVSAIMPESGITIGHLCCAAELDCKNPLPTTKHRFCLEHDTYTKQCAVTVCKENVQPGFCTCNNPDHKKIEDHLKMRGKAMFQLKRWLEQLHATQTHNTLPGNMSEEGHDDIEGVGADNEDIDFDDDSTCDKRSDKGNTQFKARFGQKWTHNEQLCVASCGVILGRATFFGSKAPNGVRLFWMKLFPTRTSLPGVMWYDNNCHIMAMLDNNPEPELRDYFRNCAMPVDVFHFTAKHKAGDDHCNRNCNPANWPELEVSPGVWWFSSSTAEQTNVWMGGYQSIVLEMSAVRYNFFLDEMIKWRNQMIIEELGASGKAPYSIPRNVLLEKDV